MPDIRSNKLPNILFLQCDQLAASFLPVYGNSVAKTPNIDSLCERSACFHSAYSNFPLCAPSRFSMLSGKLASTIGAYDNGAEFPSSVPTIAHYLRNAGYQTCLAGKMHFVGADQLHGYEQRLTTDIYPADFGWTGDWTEVVMEQSNDDSTFRDAGICTRTVQMDYDEEVVHRATRYLYDIARGQDDRPFFLTVSMSHPHDPYQCHADYWNRYEHKEIDMPVVPRLGQDQMDPYSLRLMAQYGLQELELDEDKIRTSRHAYYGSISYLDDQIGRLLATLEEAGLSDNTVIVFTSDHGDMLGERGLWYKKCFYENSVRVPLTISIPGGSPGHFTNNVSLLDILPTLVEMAFQQSAEEILVDECHGNSLLSQVKGASDEGNDVVYCEALAEGANSALVMIRQGNLKYTASTVDPDMLFDLADDPNELNNLADNNSYQLEKSRFEKLVSDRWDLDNLTEKVLQSQKQRMFIRNVLKTGNRTPWDFVPSDQMEHNSLRNNRTYNQWAYGNVLNLKRNPEAGKKGSS